MANLPVPPDQIPIDPKPRKPAKSKTDREVALSPLLYEEAWIFYRDQSRVTTVLQKKFNLTKYKVNQLVLRGWPGLNMPALRDRVIEHDRNRQQAEAKAMADKQQAEAKAMADKLREQNDAWYRAGKQFNQLADFAINTALGALSSIIRATTVEVDGRRVPRPLTKLIKRRVRVMEGEGEERKAVMRMVDEEVALTVPEALKLQHAIMQGVELASKFKHLWPIKMDDEAANPQGPPPGLFNLSQEDLEFVYREGRLPPHVTDDDLVGVKTAQRGNKEN